MDHVSKSHPAHGDADNEPSRKPSTRPARIRDTATDQEISQIIDALPPIGTKRWVARHKAVVVRAVLDGAISIQAVCERYALSVEEFDSWRRLIEQHGTKGLRSTHLQRYRDASRRQEGQSTETK